MMRDPWGAVRERAEAELRAALASRGTTVGVSMEDGPEGMADLAFPCFRLSKGLRKAPEAIAAELARELNGSGGASEGLYHWESSGPYLNLLVSADALAAAVAEAAGSTDRPYGSLPPLNSRVILEHTSANPNGPLHVGRARNPIIGDTLARILRAYGHEVETQYWVNDMGKQVNILAWGIENLEIPPYDGPFAKSDHDLVRYYQEANRRMEEDEGVRSAIDGQIRELEAGNEALTGRVRAACERVLEGMRASLERMNVRIDRFVWESESVLSGATARVIERIKASGKASEEEGACYIEMAEFGLEGERSTRFFFTRADGTSLYTTRDVAYHLWKLERCDLALNVLGEDHRLEARQLAVALRLAGASKLPESVFYSFVHLPEGKMSTRRGRVVYLDEFIEEAVERAREEVLKRRDDLTEEEVARVAEAVGVGCVRFNIVRVQPEKAMEFRWEEALSFDGFSAPFVMYAHARCAGILRRAGIPVDDWPTAGVPTPEEAALFTKARARHPSEAALVKALARLPSVVARCAEERAPHHLPIYAHGLAAQFNAFYRDCPVLHAPETERGARLALVALARRTLANALDLMGIRALGRM